MCPDWEWNLWPFGLQSGAQSTEPHQLAFKIQLSINICLCYLDLFQHTLTTAEGTYRRGRIQVFTSQIGLWRTPWHLCLFPSGSFLEEAGVVKSVNISKTLTCFAKYPWELCPSALPRQGVRATLAPHTGPREAYPLRHSFQSRLWFCSECKVICVHLKIETWRKALQVMLKTQWLHPVNNWVYITSDLWWIFVPMFVSEHVHF